MVYNNIALSIDLYDILVLARVLSYYCSLTNTQKGENLAVTVHKEAHFLFLQYAATGKVVLLFVHSTNSD